MTDGTFFAFALPCENCGQPCESRTWVPGFNYFGCDDCAAEASIMIFAEDNCPVLHDAVLRADSVSKVQKAFREHQASCPNCNPKITDLPVRRPSAPAGDRGTGQERKEAA